MTQANPLSHFPTHQVTDADNNRDQVVLRPDHFTDMVSASTTDTLEQDIKAAVDLDSNVILVLQLLKEQGPCQLAEGLVEWEE